MLFDVRFDFAGHDDAANKERDPERKAERRRHVVVRINPEHTSHQERHSRQHKKNPHLHASHFTKFSNSPLLAEIALYRAARPSLTNTPCGIPALRLPNHTSDKSTLPVQAPRMPKLSDFKPLGFQVSGEGYTACYRKGIV